ncbi:MAG: HAMP domain-containing protein [Bacteroidales bacterium]|nr:HAMP domain-containing protein [Bacteroidales bacterium]
MTRPITELSVSAMNMGMGNLKASLPDISSRDEMRRLRDSFVYLQNSITDYYRADEDHQERQRAHGIGA